jgi:hypothetical protein
MKRQDSKLKMETVAYASLLLCSLSLSTHVAADAFDHSGHSRPTTVDGHAYLLPKILPIHRFNLSDNPAVGADVGRLNIDVNGNAKLYFINPKVSSMKLLNTNLSNDLLGKPDGPYGEDENKAYYWTFQVLAIEPFEQNIYHIDVQFSDGDQHWMKYRVRGYRIANPTWQLVE